MWCFQAPPVLLQPSSRITLVTRWTCCKSHSLCFLSYFPASIYSRASGNSSQWLHPFPYSSLNFEPIKLKYFPSPQWRRLSRSFTKPRWPHRQTSPVLYVSRWGYICEHICVLGVKTSGVPRDLLALNLTCWVYATIWHHLMTSEHLREESERGCLLIWENWVGHTSFAE